MDYRAVFADGSFVAMLTTPDGIIVDCNRAFVTMCCHDMAEVLYNSVHTMCAPDVAQRQAAYVEGPAAIAIDRTPTPLARFLLFLFGDSLGVKPPLAVFPCPHAAAPLLIACTSSRVCVVCVSCAVHARLWVGACARYPRQHFLLSNLCASVTACCRRRLRCLKVLLWLFGCTIGS